jgi:hypothetical protein
MAKTPRRRVLAIGFPPARPVVRFFKEQTGVK